MWSHFLKKCLVPQNNIWLKRIIVVFSFVLFDFVVTLALCTTPTEEGNPYAKVFMELFGISSGLAMFDFLMNFPIYTMLCFNSHFINLPKRLSKVVDPLVDIVFAWFLAGTHFYAATSWFWPAPVILRQVVGAGIYLVVVITIYMKS